MAKSNWEKYIESLETAEEKAECYCNNNDCQDCEIYRREGMKAIDRFHCRALLEEWVEEDADE